MEWLLRNLSMSALIAMVLCGHSQAHAQDFGLGLLIGVEKEIVDGLDASAEFEVRSQDMTRSLERLSVKTSLDYKPIRYLSFDIVYSFIDKYTEEKSDMNGDITESYWSPRHCVDTSVTGILPLDDFEISLRERYRYTHKVEVHAKRRNEAGPMQDKIIDSEDEHLLRSRLQFAYKIYHRDMMFKPYGSMEIFNRLESGFKVDRARFIVGLEFEPSGSHGLDIYYRYTAGFKKPDDDAHLIELAYQFSF